MPGFTIHLAVAKRYIEKHKNKIINEEEFYKGTVRPDLNKDYTGICEEKEKTHYGVMGNKNDGSFDCHIDEFLSEKDTVLNNDFYKGYLLHLLTDYYFYTKYFNKELLELIHNNDKFYYDYDCINKELEDRYNIEYIANTKKFTNYSNGEPKYLKLDKMINFIEDFSDIDLEQEIEKWRV